MRKIWRGIANTIFWSYERGSWPYDVMVVAIVLFVLASPAYWFHDGPRHESPTQGVVLIHEDPVSRTEILRVDAKLLPSSPARRNSGPQFERQMHELLGNSIPDLKGRTFQIRSIDTIRGADGSVSYYEVDVKQ